MVTLAGSAVGPRTRTVGGMTTVMIMGTTMVMTTAMIMETTMVMTMETTTAPGIRVEVRGEAGSTRAGKRATMLASGADVRWKTEF